MDTTLAIALLITLYIIYVLLVKGLLWKIILGTFGWLGMYWYLQSIQTFHAHPFNNDTFSWAVVIPSVIVLLAMSYTKE